VAGARQRTAHDGYRNGQKLQPLGESSISFPKVTMIRSQRLDRAFGALQNGAVRALLACVCCFGIIVGCGRAVRDGAKGSGGVSAAQGGSANGGTPVHVGGATTTTGGAPAAGTDELAGATSEGGSDGGTTGNASGGAVASAGASGSVAGGANNPCGAGDFFVKVNGDLPGGFGADQKLTLGCADARPGVFAVPVSFSRPPPESGGIEIGIVACDGGALAVRFDQSPAFHNRSESTSLSYAVDRLWRGLDVTEWTIAEQPVTDWTSVSSGSNDGVGKVYAGSFQAQGSPTGVPVTVTGSFRVCHVANLDTP